MAYPVKNFSYRLKGAPVLNGTPGTFIEVLKACLIDGFGETTAITGKIQDGKCTITFNQGDYFEKDTVVYITGTNVQSLNGEQWVTENTDNSLSFRTLESDQTLIGTIKVKYAPVGGWSMPFTSTNIAVFKSVAENSSDVYYRFDDTAAMTSALRIYQHMTDANNGGLYIPPSPRYYAKSITANTVPRYWSVIADSQTVYYAAIPGQDFNNKNSSIERTVFNQVFGDYNPIDNSIHLKSFVKAPANSTLLTTTSGTSSNVDLFISENRESEHVVLFYNQATKNFNSKGQIASKLNTFDTAQTTLSGTNSLITHPSLLNRQGIFSNMVIVSDKHIVGELPGIFYITGFVNNRVEHAEKVIDGVGSLHGRRLKFLPCSSYTSNGSFNNTNNYTGLGLVDITGPWR